MDTKKSLTPTVKKHIFESSSIPKLLIKMSLPSMVLMLVMGSYFFFDSVLSIHFAKDAYEDGLISSTNKVRLFMNGYSPINSLMIAITLLFGMGVSTRVAINLGARKKDRALNTIKTGGMLGMGLAAIMVPILIFSAKPWISSQYDNSISKMVSDNAFKYAWPVILSLPFMMFNQIISSLLRVEARNKQMLIALVLPVFMNLFLDWIFMGPMGMGVEGGAWATFISNTSTTLLLTIFIYRTKNSVIKFGNLFGLKFKVLSIIGIILVGIAPFLRNMSSSITSTVQMNAIKDVSRQVYASEFWDSIYTGKEKVRIESLAKGIQYLKNTDYDKFAQMMKIIPGLGHEEDVSRISFLIDKQIHTSFPSLESLKEYVPIKDPTKLVKNTVYNIASSTVFANAANKMTIIATGAMPIFALFFPVMFAFAQAARPIASFNYGAKNIKRVKQVFWWNTLFAFSAAVLIFLIVGFGLSTPLMNVLEVDPTVIKDSRIAILILMSSMMAFAAAISSMVLFGSTDRIWLSIITASMQGLILFWPCIFTFKVIAIDHPEIKWLFWLYLPALACLTSIITFIIAIFTMHRIGKQRHITLDERITRANNWFQRKKIKK